MKEEKSKIFWLWLEDEIFKAKGFEGNPQQQEYDGQLWYFPSIGWTLWKDIHCFDTKKDALKYAKEDIALRIKNLKELEDRLFDLVIKMKDNKYEVPWYIWFGFGMLVMFMLCMATQVIVRIGESF